MDKTIIVAADREEDGNITNVLCYHLSNTFKTLPDYDVVILSKPELIKMSIEYDRKLELISGTTVHIIDGSYLHTDIYSASQKDGLILEPINDYIKHMK